MSYPAISLATATVSRHRRPQKRLQTARQPPVYPSSSPDYRACTPSPPFRCPHAVHPCPSVDSGLGGAGILAFIGWGLTLNIGSLTGVSISFMINAFYLAEITLGPYYKLGDGIAWPELSGPMWIIL